MIEHKNIYMALAAAQQNMGKVVKGAVNPHFKSTYADLSDVMMVALPALTEQGIAVWHSIITTDGTSAMRTNLSHGASDTHITCDVPLIVSKNDMQGMKSAVTYAKRIGIESVTGIAPEDDDGNAASKSPPPKPVVKPFQPSGQVSYITEAQVGIIKDMVADTESNVDDFLKFCRCKTFETIPAKMYPDAMDALEKKQAARK